MSWKNSPLVFFFNPFVLYFQFNFNFNFHSHCLFLEPSCYALKHFSEQYLGLLLFMVFVSRVAGLFKLKLAVNIKMYCHFLMSTLQTYLLKH